MKLNNLGGTVKHCQLVGIARDVDWGLRPQTAYSKMNAITLSVLADFDLI